MQPFRLPKSEYDVFPKSKLWYAVQFYLNNPTSSDYTIDLFNGYNQIPVPSSTAFYQTPTELNVVISTAIVANNQGAYCSVNNCLYISNDSGLFNRIIVVNCATNSIIKTFTALEISNTPRQIVYNPISNEMYVSSSSTVIRIDCSSNTVIGSPISAGGENMAYNSFNNSIYVGQSSSLDIINCNTNLIVGSVSIPVGFGFFSQDNGICYNSSSNNIYALCLDGLGSESIFIIDCNTNIVTDSIILGVVSGGLGSNGMILYNPNNNSVYVANGGVDVYAINCATNLITNTFTFPASDYQSGLALNIYNNTVYGWSSLYGGYYYIDCSNNTIQSIIPNIGVEFVSGGFYNTINNSMYIIHSNSNNTDVLRNTPNFYITGSTDYNQFLREIQNIPKRVRHITLTVDNLPQLAVPFEILKRDANGNMCNEPKLPTTYLDTSNYQPFICDLPFKPKELILNNTTIFSQYIVKANSVVNMVIFFDEIDMSDLLSEQVSIFKQIEPQCPDVNSLTEAQIESKESRPFVKPSWLKNFKKDL